MKGPFELTWHSWLLGTRFGIPFSYPWLKANKEGLIVSKRSTTNCARFPEISLGHTVASGEEYEVYTVKKKRIWLPKTASRTSFRDI